MEAPERAGSDAPADARGEGLTFCARRCGRHAHLFWFDGAPLQLLWAVRGHGAAGPTTESASTLDEDGSNAVPDCLVFVPRRQRERAPVDTWVGVLVGHTSGVTALAVLPGGTLASASSDDTVRVWDPATGRCLRVLEGHTDDVNALAVLPDGMAASASEDGTVRVWDPATGRCLRVLEGHTDWGRALAVLPDGTLASAGDDHTVLVWDPATGRCLRVLGGHTDDVNALAVLPDGTLAPASGELVEARMQPCGCGTRPRVGACASSKGTRTGSWPSRCFATVHSPRQATMEPCGCGTRPRAAACMSSKGTRTT